MTPLMIVAAVIAVPVLLLVALRINAAIIFLSLCLGSVLVQFVGNDAHSFMTMFSGNRTISDSFVSLGLLLLPAVFTLLVMIHTVHGKMRMLMNLLPALAVGFLGLLLAEPLFSPGVRGAIGTTGVWHDLQRAQALVVGLSTLISLLFLWFQRPKRPGGGDEEKHHGRRHK